MDFSDRVLKHKTYSAQEPIKKNDSQLWTELQSGSGDAFATIYGDNVQKLYAYGLKLVSDENLVKDAVQDLFVEIWNKRQKLGHVRFIRAYLFKSFRRKVLKERLVLRKKNDFFNGYKYSLPEPVSLSEERKLVEKEIFDHQLKKLRAVMEQLTDKQREIIYLKFFAQLGYDEIAAIMNISKKGVYKLMGRSIHFLRKHVDVT